MDLQLSNAVSHAFFVSFGHKDPSYSIQIILRGVSDFKKYAIFMLILAIICLRKLLREFNDHLNFFVSYRAHSLLSEAVFTAFRSYLGAQTCFNK